MQPRPSELVYTLCGSPYICAYCGDVADSIDHCVPRWFVEGNHKLIARYKLIKVHSCMQCNGFAGAKVDATFIARRRRIARKLRKRSHSLLSTASWTPEEIAELGPMLQAVVSHADAAAHEVLMRLRVLDNPIPPPDIPNDLFIRKAPLMAMSEAMA